MRAVSNGVVIAESEQTIKVEGTHYFPPESVDWRYLTPSLTQTVCPWKGRANYYTVTVDGRSNPDAAWYYPKPRAAAAKIQDHVAFWHGVQVQRTGALDQEPKGFLRRFHRH